MKTTKLFRLVEKRAAEIILLALALIPCLQMLIRVLFSADIPDYDMLIKHLTLWTALVAGMATTRDRQHISLGFNENLPEGRFRTAIESIILVSGSAISIATALAALSFSIIGFDANQKIGFISLNILSAIIALSFAVTGIRFITSVENRKKGLLPAGIIIGLILGLPTIINIMYMTPFMPPIWLEDALSVYYIFFEAADIILVILLIVLAVFGLPIFLLLGGAAYILFAGTWSVPEVIPNEIYNLLTGTAIPAIPLFTLTGFVLSEGNSGERLVNLFRAFIGRMPGGLAIMAVLVCAFFTTFTGASGVTILALGGLLSYIMLNSGEYSDQFTKGYITSAGSIGLLFPPSLPIIMYGIQAKISIKDMFLGGIIPGVILVAALSGMGIFHARKARMAGRGHIDESQIPDRLGSLRRASGDLMLPVIILVLYFGGITTLVETGAVAVVYSIILEVFIYRKLKLKELSRIIGKTIPVIGGVLMIIAMAKGLSYFIVDAEIPMYLTSFFSTHVNSPLVFLLLLNIVLLITGCLMDIFSAIMVVAPLIIPLGEMYGIHPVQLGIIFLANLQLGYLTPPVGLNLFLASYAFETPLAKIYRGVIPFFLVLLAMVLLITYVPFFSLSLLG
ncbi:MAG: TRAP transporter large permease subunit [Spirochaetales bacterium]|uniref:TRAP transporter large permease subunit n=1 Tax=Candidatus Thalassospirochaeta sargassi TaxID=3119039 RepID=A0AAJ1ML14_9SPIO|nr:TRAP transporter large permease subunit [Spirochaetales bacterium]